MSAGKYRLTTIERLAPSLQQIDFQLTHTALEEQKKVQSLAFSVSIQKISFHSIKANDHSFDTENSLKLQQKMIQIQNQPKNNQIELKQSAIIKQMSNKTKIMDNKCKKKRQTVQITTAILYFEDPKQATNLQSTSSTIKNNSPIKYFKNQTPTLLKNRTKKSASIKICPSNIKTQKCCSPKQKNKQNRIIPQAININFRLDTRKKILSTRK